MYPTVPPEAAAVILPELAKAPQPGLTILLIVALTAEDGSVTMIVVLAAQPFAS